MQSSPPMSDGKARAIRELSRSLSHSPRSLPSLSPPASDSNPTKHSGFGTETSNFFNDPDILMSTQHKIDDETNTLPQYPRIRSTAKKINTWHMLRSEQPVPDTSMVNKQFGDFDQSLSDEDHAIEQSRALPRGTPGKISSPFNSLYDITPPTNRSRKSLAAETGSLRRDAQLRRASRNDYDNASPRPVSKRNSPALGADVDRKRTTLAQLHAKISADESSFMDHRPPTVVMDTTKNTRWGSRQTSLQLDGTVDSPQTRKSRPGTAQNATAQSFILPDLPNLTELVSGVFDDGTPVFSKTAPSRSRFAAPPNGGRKPQHIPIEGVPIPEEEKAIFAALQLLQDKLSQMESERAEQDRRLEEQELELIELRATTQAQEKLRQTSSSDSDGKGSWKVEKTRLDATVQTLRTKLDRADRKTAVLEIEKKRLSTERDNMASQLNVAFQTCEELKTEKSALASENDHLRLEVDNLRAEVESLRDQLEHEHSHHREETVQLQRQFDQAANATQSENATLHAELARARAQNDENTQQLSRKDVELRKARKEQAEFARLQADHESLKAQLAELKNKREEEVKRWTRQEASLKAQVDRRDETIRQFQDMTQEQTNEAMRTDNENLRAELAQLSAQHQAENDEWARREHDLKRRVQQREQSSRKASSSREALSMREANDQQYELSRKPSYHREDTRTRIKNRVQQEVRNSKNNQYSTYQEESPRKSYTGVSRFSNRSFSAPIHGDKHARVESDVESTTDLSLAPRNTPHATRTIASMNAGAAVNPPADLDLTELSYIDSKQIAQLRRVLEEERAAARQRSSSAPIDQVREDTVRSRRETREDTVRSVASHKSERRQSLPRKSSLKDVTQRTQFEEDVTGDLSNVGGDAEATQTKQSAIDLSMLSNTSRRRRSAPNEMTSAFILPDIKLDTIKLNSATITSQNVISKDHDNRNCTVCRREGMTAANDAFRVPKLVPVSSRMPEDIDATLRPARSPKEALALVVKELQDERAHLHMELAVMRAMLEAHDSSLGNRKRRSINESIQDILRRLEIKDTQIYNLYDVLEGQQTDDLTELDVENLTQQIRAEEEKQKTEPEKKAKKVTIRSFVDEDDDSIEIGRGAARDLEEETQELPWEGFEDTGLDADESFAAISQMRRSRVY